MKSTKPPHRSLPFPSHHTGKVSILDYTVKREIIRTPSFLISCSN